VRRGGEHLEWWTPAESLEELNDNIAGGIEVVAKYPADAKMPRNS